MTPLPVLDQLRESIAASYASKEPVELPPFEYADQADFDVCLRPRAALNTFPYLLPIAITQLQRELAVRRIVAIADQVIWQDNSQTRQAHLLIVPAWVWNIELRMEDDFWDTGYLERLLPVKGYGIDASRWIKLYDVRFWPEGLPNPKERTSAPAIEEDRVKSAPKGGRPPKPWWDALWVEIARQLYSGKLKPDRQSDIEKAMLEWASIQGESLSETSARTAARKLFQALSAEDKN